MGILEQILDELKAIRAALENGASTGGGSSKSSGGDEKTEDKPKGRGRTKKPSGPSLEDVQNKIRALVAEDEDNKEAISAAIKKLGGKRAGDFEGEDDKLAKLMTALEKIEGEAGSDGDEDDDLL